MNKLLLIVLAVFFTLSNSGIAQLQPDCATNPSMRYQFGDYCLEYVSEGFIEGIQGYYPIGSYLEFVLTDGETDIGRITGYHWIIAEQRYHYQVVTRPVNDTVEVPVMFPLEEVSPDDVLAASEEIWAN